MRRSHLSLALAALSLAGVASAQLSATYKEWPSSPAGFLLTTLDGKKLYLAGDTGLFGDMALIGEEGIDLAVLPIGDNFTMGAEVSRLQMPPNVLNIRVMCSGRINPMHVIRAFSQGADAVLVSGCHMGDCHYITGNYYARRRLLTLKSVLTGLGIEPERFRVTWISAAEAQDYQTVITEIAGM